MVCRSTIFKEKNLLGQENVNKTVQWPRMLEKGTENWVVDDLNGVVWIQDGGPGAVVVQLHIRGENSHLNPFISSFLILQHVEDYETGELRLGWWISPSSHSLPSMCRTTNPEAEREELQGSLSHIYSQVTTTNNPGGGLERNVSLPWYIIIFLVHITELF